MIAIDGTKVHAKANRDRTVDYDAIARAIVEGQVTADAAQDAGSAPGVVTNCRAGGQPPGPRGLAGEVRQPLEQRRAAQPQPVPRSRPRRLLEPRRRRLEEELAVERDANAQYEAFRAGGDE